MEKQQEKRDEIENTSVTAYYIRHAEKSHGAVTDDSGSTISTSGISQRGATESKQLGEQLNLARDGSKLYHSDLERTEETGSLTISSSTSTKTYKPRENLDLSVEGNPKAYTEEFEEFGKIYYKRWTEEKQHVMQERGITQECYDNKLSPTEQSDISEEAEEVVLEEWLDNPDGQLSSIVSAEKAASLMAPIVSRDLKKPTKLKKGSEIDVFRVTHKTIMEPLLMHILRLEDGDRPRKLNDIGGSLKLNEGIKFVSSINQNGEKSVKAYMLRVDRTDKEPKYVVTEFDLDLPELDRLTKNKY